jgi:hypothetical protein
MLAITPFTWRDCFSSLTGTPANTPPVSMTSGVSNADGAAVTLLSALARDVHYLVLNIHGTFTSAIAQNCLLDLLVDPAGGTSWTELIDSLICGYLPGNTPTVQFHFPLFVKAGSSIGCRMRTSHTAAPTNTNAQLWAYSEPSRPDAWWCGQKVESLGVVPASSEGTAITPGNTGTYSAYVAIGTSTRRYGALQLAVQPDNATVTAIAYYWRLGIGSVDIPGMPRFWSRNFTDERMYGFMPVGPLFCDIPGNTAIQLRATGSGTSIAHTAAVYGVY